VTAYFASRPFHSSLLLLHAGPKFFADALGSSGSISSLASTVSGAS